MPVDFGTEDDPGTVDFGHEDEFDDTSGFETITPQEEAQIESESARLEPATGLRASLSRLRGSPFARQLLGPPAEERENMVGSTGSPGEIASSFLKFTTPPPPLANLARQLPLTLPMAGVGVPIPPEMLPATARGALQGVRETALNFPLAPIPVAPKLAMGAFAGQFTSELPAAKEAYQAALDRGDKAEAAKIATETVAGGALMGLGSAHAFTTKGPNAQTIRSNTGQVPEEGAIPQGIENQGRENLQLPPSGQPESVAARGELQAQAPEASQEQARVLLNPEEQAKWTKATESLSPIDQARAQESAAKPLNWQSFSGADAEGRTVLDIGKIKEAVRNGELSSDGPTDALLNHLLEKSGAEEHPLEAIQLHPEAAPEEWRGRFSQPKGSRVGLIELFAKQKNGEPVSQAEFAQTLTHELVHNNITSKVKDAPKEIVKDVDDLFSFVKEAGKGTEFENHNALSHAFELFAEITDPKVRDWLASLDYSKDIRRTEFAGRKVASIAPKSIRESALGKFLEIAKKLLKLPDFIMDAFGRKVDTITALDQAISLSSKLETVRRSGAEDYMQSFSKTPEEVSKDLQRYQELQKDLMERINKGDYDSEEFNKLWKESEDIKNRNGGMPPPGATQAPATKYTGATSELGGQMLAGIPNPVAVARSVANLAKQTLPAVKNSAKALFDFTKKLKSETLDIEKISDTDKALMNWSGKGQRSFYEADAAQRDLMKSVKNPLIRDGIVPYIQAGGDRNTLVKWFTYSGNDPKLQAGYKAAIDLYKNPEAIAAANDAKAAFDRLGQRGKAWGILNSFRDNYVTQIWDLGKMFGRGGSVARTIKERFKYAKARTFENYFEGEQEGFKPRTKDIAKILPMYIHEMNSVIAGRQLVKEMSDGVGSDGRPLFVPKPDTITTLEGEVPGEKTTLIKPRTPEDTKGYKTMPNQPALQKWVWAGKDEAGNPIFQKAELMVHPEAYKKLNAALGISKIKEWYRSESQTAAAAILKAIAYGLDVAQSEIKRTMLSLAPFHQVQEGWHGLAHRVNPWPWSVERPNLDNPAHLDAVKHGLMVFPDKASDWQFMGTGRPSGLVSFIPGLGKVGDWYNNYLFHSYIPGLKLKVYDAALKRNLKVYEKELQSKKVSLTDVKALTAEQTNAGFGHLNYAKLGRNPTIQHIAQWVFSAPDFLEARGRFALQALRGATPQLGAQGERIKGAGFSKAGREQILALATIAIGQAALAYTMAHFMDGEWDGKHPFEFKKGNRRYTMRSVPEDAMRLLTDTRAFIYNRINPLTAKLPYELYSQKDWRDQKISREKALASGAKSLFPLPSRGFLGIDESPLQEWEQLASSLGLKIMRYSPEAEIHQLYTDWQKKSENKRMAAQAEQRESSTFPTSEYYELRQALEKEDYKRAKEEYQRLLEVKKPIEVNRVMKPYRVDVDTGSLHERIVPKGTESRFLGSLTEDQRKIYTQAKAHRRLLYARFQKMLGGAE